MDFDIPGNLKLTGTGHTTLIRAKEALAKHEPDRAARLLQKAKIKNSREEMARDLMLAATLSHCNLPGKALQTVMSSLMSYPMDDEQQLYHRIVQGELLSTLGKVSQATKILESCPEKALTIGRHDLAAEALIRESSAAGILGNRHLAMSLISKALSICGDISDPSLTARALVEKSALLFSTGDLPASLEIAKEAVDRAGETDLTARALGYRRIGMVQGAYFRFFESLEAHRTALQIFNEQSNITGRIQACLSMADTYLDMGDIGLAAHFAKKAKASSEDGDNTALSAAVYGTLGRLSLAGGQIGSALERFEMQLALAKKHESSVVYAEASQRIGSAKIFAGDTDGAFTHLKEAISQFIKVEDTVNIEKTLLELAQIEPRLSDAQRTALAAVQGECKPSVELTTQQTVSRKTRAKAHLATAYHHLAAGRFTEAAEAKDEGIHLLEQAGCGLEAAFALYTFGRTALSTDPIMGCESLAHALRIADVHDFVDLSKLILSTMGAVEGIGEEIVVEYSLDKAAVMQLGGAAAPQGVAPVGPGTEIVGRSPQLLEVLKEIERFAPTDLPVLVLGPSGTGKELAAKRTHELSRRSTKPFVAVNCAALPPGIIDVELFGGKKGAYTGLQTDRKGLILEADGGTLFLDEIGDFPLELQPKLLRFLQEGEVRPLGSDKTQTVDVRIVAATNADLKNTVGDGKFREDLFYRLSVVTLDMPALKDRGNDVVLIARHLLQKSPLAKQRGIDGFSRAAEDLLLSHTWPGNIRELVNVIQTATVRAEGTKISADDLRMKSSVQPAPVLRTENLYETPPQEADFQTRDTTMKENIRKALARTGGNQSEAADQLGIHRNTLRNWLKRMKAEGSL